MDLARLFESEAANLTRFLRRFGRTISAEDVTQEAFLRLCAGGRSEVASPRAYLFAVARNVARDRARMSKQSPVFVVANVDALKSRSPAPTPEEARIAAQEAEALAAAIDALPPLQRDALILRRVELLSPTEVASRLGVSERHVQRLVLQAIAFCHARLTAEGDNTVAVD
jgi:RNA polymerase sigma-70 factor (ECF subfamily)